MSFKVEQKHSLPKDDALVRIRALSDYLHNKHGIGVTWDGDRAQFNGRFLVVTIEGSVIVGPDAVTFDGKDPGILWRGKARDYLTHKLAKYLDPATPADQLPRA